MIGLTHYDRDLELPGKLGDERLIPPSESGLTDLVNEHLLRAENSAGPDLQAVSSEVAHVRYKSRVAIAATYAVRLNSGEQRAITYKAHLGDKGQQRLVGGRYASKLAEDCSPLRPFAYLEERGASLWVCPADPELRGLIRAFDMRRTARWIDRLNVEPGWVMRVRASTLELKRYKYSRRAVLQVVAKFRCGESDRRTRGLGLRVLPPAIAAKSIAQRALVADFNLPIPRLLGWDESAGWLLEEWLPGTPSDRDDLSITPQAMACVVRLHRSPTVGLAARESRTQAAPVALLGAFNKQASLPAWLSNPVEVPSTARIHGDLHPDQVLIDGAQSSLLDLDSLRYGSKEEDLASWIVDGIALRNECGVDFLIGSTVEQYRTAGGDQVDEPLLRMLVAVELVCRAAAGVRRLEQGAIRNASRLLDQVNPTLGVAR